MEGHKAHLEPSFRFQAFSRLIDWFWAEMGGIYKMGENEKFGNPNLE